MRLGSIRIAKKSIKKDEFKYQFAVIGMTKNKAIASILSLNIRRPLTDEMLFLANVPLPPREKEEQFDR